MLSVVIFYKRSYTAMPFDNRYTIGLLNLVLSY